MAAALPLVTEPALQRLSQLTTLYIKQMSSGYRNKNGSKYIVFGEGEEVLFKLNEIVPDTIFRGGAYRPFQFNGVDNTGKKLFTFGRPKGKILITQKVKLFMDDDLISIIRVPFLKPNFNINDALDNPVIRLKGQMSDLSFSFFQLQTNDKTTIGAVHKKFRGWKKELFSCKDEYIITVPVDLAVPFKIAVIVACVFLDITLHEGK